MEKTDKRQPHDQGPQPTGKPPRWGAPALLAVILVAIVVSQTALRREPPAPAPDLGPAAASSESVMLVIDTAAGEPVAGAVAWREGMTVLDALEAAPQGWPGPIERTGAGAGAFVSTIKGIANDPAGDRFWQYYIDGQRGEVGAGARVLEPGERVLWKFAPQE